jgi:hypothetical protein
MRTERYEFEGFGGVRLPAVLWLPDGAPKCVLQITHGMTEHMGRYARFGEDLCQYGIAVAGFDLRGHGENATDPTVASFGPGGWEASIADMRLFYEDQEYGELELVAVTSVERSELLYKKMVFLNFMEEYGVRLAAGIVGVLVLILLLIFLLRRKRRRYRSTRHRGGRRNYRGSRR